MIDFGKQDILGVGVNAVDYEAAVDKIVEAARESRPFMVSALAVHGVMTGVQDPAHKARLNQFDLIVPDGQPVRWAMKWLHGVALPERVYGPLLALKVCERAAIEGLPLFLYGSRPEVLSLLVEKLQERFPALEIAGARPSLFRQTTAEEQRDIADAIRDSGARITLAGLGCPRQEVWVYEYARLLSMPALAVGAAFDFHAGTLAQAPSWMQRRGLEWLYRLGMEPRRLWRRYLYLNPLYLMLLALQGVGLYQGKEAPLDAIPALRYG